MFFPALSEELWFLGRPVRLRRKSFRRNWSVTISSKLEIIVCVGKTTNHEAVTSFLEKMKPWLSKNLKEFERLHKLYPPKKFIGGERFLWKGREITLAYEAHSQKKKIQARIEEPFLKVSVPFSWDRDHLSYPQRKEVKKAVISCYKKEGISFLTDRLKFWIQKTGLRPHKVGFRAQKTLWGSCSDDKRISLNWKLVALESQFVDYVIVHELSHLKIMSHSRNFWKLVETYIPSYKEIKQEVKDYIYRLDFLNRVSEFQEI